MSTDISKLEFEVINFPFWLNVKMEIAKDDKDIIYHRKKGSKVVYVKEIIGFSCLDCEAQIKSITIHHPIHDGPFPLSGREKVEKEYIPYCPNCEEEPKYIRGNPIVPRGDGSAIA